MRKVLVGIVMACALYSGATLTALAQQPDKPLTNAAVIKLVRAGFKEKTVIAIIHSRPHRFELDPDRLIELKRSGVSENIILTMLAQDDALFLADDDLGNGPPLTPGQNGRRSQGQDHPPAGGADIFGSSGSSRGQTRGRGQSAANEGDTVTTGSATVRIVRPPAEESSGTARLERTPTLDNEAVVKLVDAGFSEGTIIKRIEDSPVDFDLSPTKLADLRKHRVSEPIIAAMNAAMKDEATPGNAPIKPREN